MDEQEHQHHQQQQQRQQQQRQHTRDMDVDSNAEFQVDTCSLDFEEYPSKYMPSQALLRLKHIADHCPSVRWDALSVAAKLCTTCSDIGTERLVAGQLRDLAAETGKPLPQFLPEPSDLDAKAKQLEHKRRQLEDELNVHKSNLVKDRIGRAYFTLGEFYIDMGNYTEAQHHMLYARSYLPQPKHLVEIQLRVFVSMLAGQETRSILVSAPRFRSLLKDHSTDMAEATLHACAGVANLVERNYREAAAAFLQLKAEALESTQVLTTRDVAAYATLCCIATMSRDEINDRLLSNPEFRDFLESNGQMRELGRCFHASDFERCLELLTTVKNDLYLDPYLFGVLDDLYATIRVQALNQYFAPYKTLRLSSMASAFKTTVEDLENELARVIADDRLVARIDSDRKVLCAVHKDPREQAVERGLQVMQNFQHKAEMLLLNAAVVKNDLALSAPTGSQAVTRRQSARQRPRLHDFDFM